MDRDGLVAKADPQFPLRVELEPGELLVETDVVDGGGVGLQVNQVHIKHHTQVHNTMRV